MLQHLHSKDECYLSFDLNYFSILDLVTPKYQTKLKEGMYIDWEKRNLDPPPSVHYLMNLINFYGFSFFLLIFEFITIILIAFIIVDFV